jgi:hypothetical protein
MANVIPQTYADWRYCITVQCGLALSPDYIQSRIHALSTAGSEETERFRRLYGDPHWQNVLAWFRQAQAELPSL